MPALGKHGTVHEIRNLLHGNQNLNTAFELFSQAVLRKHERRDSAGAERCQ